MRDSSGYSIPHTADRLDLIYTLSAKNDAKSHRIEAYIQDTYHFNKGDNFFTLNYGVRLANWSFNKAGVRSPGEGKADGTNSVMMKLPSQFYTVTPINYNTNMATLTIFNTGAYVAKYSLDYSTDGGETWTRALTSAGNASVDVPARTSSIGYWPLKISSKKSALYRISQVGGNKNASTYVDNFTLYYTENVEYLFGDVNGDGEVNIMDINAIINIILGGNVDDDTRARADLTADGEVTISDINVLVSILIQ